MRKSKITRKTKETDIEIILNLDGSGIFESDCENGFLNHMLNLFTLHSNVDLTLNVKGDIEVDNHHTVEDIGIVLGKCFNEALGDKKGINRYGTFYIPMDEALIRTSLDISGRSFLKYNVNFTVEKLGQLETEMIKEFFRAFCENSKTTIHIDQISGENNHHICEGIFKSFGRVIKEAVKISGYEIPSTKGSL